MRAPGQPAQDVIAVDECLLLHPLLDEMHWSKVRDLALLALASYKPASKEEEEALAAQGTESEEVE